MPITAKHAKSNTIADFTGTITVGNSSGGTQTMMATDLVRPVDWNSSHNMTISLSGSEIASLFNVGNGLSSSSDASGLSFGMASDQWYEPFTPVNTTTPTVSLFSQSNATWYFDGPYQIDQAIGKGQVNLFMAFPANFLGGAAYSATTGSVTRTATLWDYVALYTRPTNSNSTRLESFWTMLNSWLATNEMRLNTANTSSGTLSNYLTVSFPSQYGTDGGTTYGSSSASGTSNLSTSSMASTRYDSLITGAGQYLSGSLMVPFGFSTTLPPGIYWVGRMMNTSTASAGTSGGIAALGTYFGQGSYYGGVMFAGNAYKRLGNSASNSSTNFAPFQGYLATSTTLASSAVGTADIRGSSLRAYWNYLQSSY